MQQNTTRRIFAAMHWSSVIGQPSVQQILQRCIVQGRIPQAMLMCGNDGFGTMALALEFARTVNCRAPVIDGESVAPCGQCQSCTQARSMQHPNILLVSAIPTGKLEGADELRKEWIDGLYDLARELGRNPYGPTRMEGANEIRAVQIRELNRQLSLSMIQQGRRVAIVANADDMNVSTANAFLKTLEEPHADTTIIMTTSRRDRLLPTIISRCQVITVPALDESTIVEALVVRGNHDHTEAQIAASLSQGDYSSAEAYLSEDVRGIRDGGVDLLRTALRGKEMRPTLVAAVAEIAGSRDRARCQAVCNALLLWLRDAYAIATGGSAVSILNVDQREPLERFAVSFAAADFDVAYRSIERAAADIDRFVPPQIVLLTMMMELRTTFLRARQRT
jgi:DNA polymerase-3 subunit delta'